MTEPSVSFERPLDPYETRALALRSTVLARLGAEGTPRDSRAAWRAYLHGLIALFEDGRKGPPGTWRHRREAWTEAMTRRVIRRPFPDRTDGLSLLIWEAPAGGQDGKRGALLDGAIDGGASHVTPGDVCAELAFIMHDGHGQA
jgi:hypothetical protein